MMNPKETTQLALGANALGAMAALIALWTGQTIPRIALAYALAASIPASVCAYLEMEESQ